MDISKIFGKENIISALPINDILRQATPIIEKEVNKLSDYMGDGEKIIMFIKPTKDSDITMLVIDTKKEFALSGGEKVVFNINPKDSPIIKKISISAIINIFLKDGLNKAIQSII